MLFLALLSGTFDLDAAIVALSTLLELLFHWTSRVVRLTLGLVYVDTAKAIDRHRRAGLVLRYEVLFEEEFCFL